VLEQVLGVGELELVAAAVLLGGELDVGDPVAVLVGVVDRLAGGDALGLDGFGAVQEPVDLLLGGRLVINKKNAVPDAQRIWKNPTESASP